MKSFSRRDFLKYCGIGAIGTGAALAVAGCAKEEAGNAGTSTGSTGSTTNTGSTGSNGSTEVKDVPDQEVIGKSALTSDETMIIAISGEPNHMLPALQFGSNNVATVLRMFYEPLIALDWPNDLSKEGLATDWEFIDDTHLRVKLRKGVYFQNGEEFNADDVLYQFTQGLPSLMYNNFLPDECVKEDDYTVVLAAAAPHCQLLKMLTFQHFMMIEDSVLKAAGGAATSEIQLVEAGTGKYRLAEWKAGEYVLCERNEDYWNNENDPGYFKYVKFVFIADATANALAVQSGDVDVSASASLANIAVYEADPNLKVTFYNPTTISTLFLNSNPDRGGPCCDENIRKAVYELIDVEAIRQVATYGYGILCDSILAPDNPYNDGINRLADKKVDVEAAKAYLAEAGYPDGGVTLQFACSGSSLVVEMLQEQLRAGGIELDLLIGDMPTHFANLGSGNFDAYMGGSQDAFFSENLRCSDQLGWDFSELMGGCGFKDEYYHSLIAGAIYSSDEEVVKKNLLDAQAYYREHCVSIPMYQSQSIIVTDPDLEGFTLFGLACPNYVDMYSTER